VSIQIFKRTTALHGGLGTAIMAEFRPLRIDPRYSMLRPAYEEETLRMIRRERQRIRDGQRRGRKAGGNGKV